MAAFKNTDAQFMQSCDLYYYIQSQLYFSYKLIDRACYDLMQSVIYHRLNSSPYFLRRNRETGLNPHSLTP